MESTVAAAARSYFRMVHFGLPFQKYAYDSLHAHLVGMVDAGDAFAVVGALEGGGACQLEVPPSCFANSLLHRTGRQTHGSQRCSQLLRSPHLVGAPVRLILHFHTPSTQHNAFTTQDSSHECFLNPAGLMLDPQKTCSSTVPALEMGNQRNALPHSHRNGMRMTPRGFTADDLQMLNAAWFQLVPGCSIHCLQLPGDLQLKCQTNIHAMRSSAHTLPGWAEMIFRQEYGV